MFLSGSSQHGSSRTAISVLSFSLIVIKLDSISRRGEKGIERRTITEVLYVS